MAKKINKTLEKLNYLQSNEASYVFATDLGHLGDASRAVEPIFKAFEKTDVKVLPKRISKTYKKQVETEIKQLKKARLKRVIRITSAKFISPSELSNDGFGFIRWVDDSRDWRECEIEAAVLERYIDSSTGECIIENFDESARLVIRQSRHIRARDRSQNKFSMKDVYVREHYNCPSCGAALEHVADETNCSYCGAVITFNFYDWQLDSFYLDMHKNSLLGKTTSAVTTAASTAATATAVGAITAVELLEKTWDQEDAASGTNTGMNNQLGAILAVLFLIGYALFSIFSAVPPFVRMIAGIAVTVFVIWQIIKYIKASDQKRKKKKIDRYSDGYLRSCIYDQVWKEMNTDHLIDFSIDDIIIKSVKNTDQTTMIDVIATVIKKYIGDDRKIQITLEDVEMKLGRARYPEKVSSNSMMEEKECPSCGANFEPDDHHCCSYCGYGLKMENFVWRKSL